MPASLHAQLAAAAEVERVSLNQFLCYVLAGAVHPWTRRLEGGAIEGSRLEVGDVRRHELRLIEEGWRDMFR